MRVRLMMVTGGGSFYVKIKYGNMGHFHLGMLFFWGVQHFSHHLSSKGIGDFVLSNGSMSSNFSGEGEIRKNIIEATIVDCMIALPSQLFYTAPIARANVRLVNRLTTICHTKKSYVKQIMLREDFSVIEVIF